VQAKFEPAYITLTDAVALNPRRYVAFQLNTTRWPVVDLYHEITVRDSRDLVDKVDFWSHLVVASYQGPPAEDRDPNGEDTTLGDTPNGAGVTVIYLETIRDDNQASVDREQRFPNALYAIVGHEIGHPPGGRSGDEDHAEVGLMRAGNDRIIDVFTHRTLRRFREAKKWNE
jgi:hypothetical protein